MANLGPFEIVVIAVVVVLLFGTRRLPELGSGLGKAIANFRNAFKDGSEQGEAPKVAPPPDDKKLS